MAGRYLELLSTPEVLKQQQHYFGAAQLVPPQRASDRATDPLTSDEIDFIGHRESFYLATVSSTGWPYMQHRGGPVGFLKVVNPSLLAFADFKGNRQLISTGNLKANDRVSLFLMDYPQRTRLKVLGHARIEDAREHPELIAQFSDPATQRLAERIFFIDVVSYDWNCPKYITPRYSAEEVKQVIAPLRERIAELEAQLKAHSIEPLL